MVLSGVFVRAARGDEVTGAVAVENVELPRWSWGWAELRRTSLPGDGVAGGVGWTDGVGCTGCVGWTAGAVG